MLIFAYLDPATGTLIISAIVGAIAAIGLVFKNSWYKMKRMVTGKSKDDAKSVELPVEEG